MKKLILTAFSLAVCAFSVQARQIPQLDGQTLNLFGSKAFSADMTMTYDGKAEGALSCKVFIDRGMSRYELDMTGLMKGNAAAGAMLKKMGMDQMVVISKPSQQLTYMVYPGKSAYVETTLPPQPAVDTKAPALKPAGTATIDGHDCAVFTVDTKTAVECTVYEAKDLGNFPIKIVSKGPGFLSEAVFTHVNVGAQPDSLFTPPVDYAKHPSVQELMMGALKTSTN
jgi:hypothetical protein